MPRHLALTAAALVLALLLPAGASAAPTHGCKSDDMRYPFQPGQPKYFGVHRLQITGGSCTTARRVAKTWMQRFEAEIQRGRIRLPRRVEGFRFRTLPNNKSQTYTERGRKGRTTIRFDYVVPNG